MPPEKELPAPPAAAPTAAAAEAGEAAAAAPAAAAAAEELFCCDVCNCMRPLLQGCMADLDCACCICSSCADEHIRAAMQPQDIRRPAAPPTATGHGQADVFAVGQAVRYHQRLTGELVLATVVQIDRSINPPQYGIRLDSATEGEVRFTEQSRLLPSEACIQQGFPAIHCPCCSRLLDRPVLARAYPAALQALDDALTAAWLSAKGIIRCPTPSCEALIEKLPARGQAEQCRCAGQAAGSSRTTTATSSGNSSASSSGSRFDPPQLCACLHKAAHRYRCAACTQTFCDACRASPYHEGLTCEQAAAPHCPLCGTHVLEAAQLSTAGLSIKALREGAVSLGMDCTWCLERSELVAAWTRAKHTCAGCRPKLAAMCSRQLPCRHWCCGARGDSPCLPCVEGGCEQQGAALGDGSCCFCWEPLSSGAAIPLSCTARHLVHLQCARKRLKVGCPRPALTFDFLFCPLCGSGSAAGRCGNVQVMTAQPHLQHGLLQEALAHPLHLRQQVVQLAKARLKLAALPQDEADLLRPGGAFDGRPVDFALSRFLFFECSRCKQAYFGGMRQCGAVEAAAPGDPAAAAAPFDASELVCGSCSAIAAGSNCPKHGTAFVEYKCEYCCDVAGWFCWGRTHMCSRCHDNPSERHHTCPGSSRCKLTIPHPRPPSSMCLGCGVCRYAA